MSDTATAAREQAAQLLADALSLPREEVSSDAALGTLAAWDSLGHMSVIAAIEQRLERELDAAELVAIRDLGDVAQVLAER